MMKHLFAPYHIAVLLKEKGFNEKCLGYFKNEDELQVTGYYCNNKLIVWIAAPIYSQVLDWINKTTARYIRYDVREDKSRMYKEIEHALKLINI